MDAHLNSDPIVEGACVDKPRGLAGGTHTAYTKPGNGAIEGRFAWRLPVRQISQRRGRRGSN